jgi:alkylation response protein AidB-like acyl-CoA dehydrogenase
MSGGRSRHRDLAMKRRFASGSSVWQRGLSRLERAPALLPASATLEDALEDRGRASLFSSPQLGRTGRTRWTRWKHSAGQGYCGCPDRRPSRTYTIFEGTSEIQRLVVARAISGLHIP